MLQGFKDVPRAVWLLSPGAFVNAVSSFTFVFVFVYLTGPRGVSVAEAGLITGIGGIGLIAGNFTGGGFGDRYGHRRVLLIASALAGGALVLLPVLPTTALYFALPPAQYASGAIRSANAALVAVIVPEGARRQSFAVVRCVSNGGFTLGAPLGALIATGLSYDWLFVADGIGTLVFALWTARVVPASGAANTPAAAPDGGLGRGVWGELRARPAVLVLLAAIFLVDVIYRQQYSTFPVYLADHGLDTGVYGLIIALNGAVILLLELPAAVALRTRPPLRVIGVGLLLVGAGYGALLLGTGIAAAVAMMVLLSLGEILYKTPATAYVADQAPAHAIGRFQSLYAGVSVSGVVFGGPLGGALYSAAPALLWPLCAALAAGAGGVVLWMSVRVARGPRELRPAGETRLVREPAPRSGPGPAPRSGPGSEPGPEPGPAPRSEPGPEPGPAEDPAGHDPRPAHETGSRPRAVAG